MLTLLLALSTPEARAGTNADVAAGIEAYEGRDYERAIADLQRALSEPARLRKKNIPRAHAYLAKALIAALTEAVSMGNVQALSALEDAPLQAAASLLIVRDHPVDSYRQTTEMELLLVQSLLQQGVMSALSLSGEDGAELAGFVAWADMAVAIGGPLSLDLRGQLRARLGDPAGAYADYLAALALCHEQPPEHPDLLIAYAAYRAATLARDHVGDVSAALAHVERGLALLTRELGRLEAPTLDQQRQHDDAWADLGNLRLSLLRSDPAQLDIALAAAAAAVAAEPDRYALRIAHAQLLEQVDPGAAAREYEAAQALEPDQVTAWFSLGALYMRRAVARYQAASAEGDEVLAAAMLAEGRASFLLARPFLERALKLDPSSREIIGALQQIALQTDDIEAYRRLLQQEQALP